MNTNPGTPQNDTLYGTGGDDSLGGAAGNDLLRTTIDQSIDVVDGGAGDDRLEIVASLYLDHQAYQAKLTGGEGNDTLAVFDRYGSLDAKAVLDLDGGDGDDVFILDTSSGGAAILATGGTGTDRYEIGARVLRSNIVISDFAAGEGGDVIDLGKPIADALGTIRFAGKNPFAPGSLFRLTQTGADTTLEILDYSVYWPDRDPHSLVVTLRDVDKNSLTAANFAGALQPDGRPMPGKVLTAPDSGAVLAGGYLDDTLTGGAGQDVLSGAQADDFLDGRGGDDLLRGEDGHDTLLGGGGNDTLYGGTGSDSLDGGAGDDVLAYGDQSSRSGGSTLSGGDGNDTFRAQDYMWSPGTSLMSGGAGSDTYVLQARGAGEEGHLTITDFATGRGGDVLVLDAIVDDTRFDGGNPFDPAFGYLSWKQQGSTLLLLYNIDGPQTWHPERVVLTLLDTRLEDLVPENLLYKGMPIPPTGGAVPGIALDVASFYNQYTVFDDTLRGNGEAQQLEGGGGNDIIHGGSETAPGVAGGDAIDGGSGNDTLWGEGGDDAISGGSGNDSIDGGAGNDTLVAISGDDSVAGGAGDDIISTHPDLGRVTIDGGAGSDTLRLGGNIGDFYYDKLTANGFTIYHDGTGFTQVTGVERFDFADATGLTWLQVKERMVSLGDDRLAGTDGADLLDGLAGNDTMAGGKGDDVYIVEAAGDVVVEGVDAGYDTVRTALGQARLDANVEKLEYTGSGDFRATGNAGGNAIHGSASGNNTLDGGAGADTLFGGSERNEFIVDTEADVIDLFVNTYSVVKVAFAASGTYRMATYVHDGVITAATGLKVNLTGNWQRNTLTGNAGDNVLDGGDGNDTLDGGAGADTLQGSSGNDTFIVNDRFDTIVEGEYTGDDTALVSLNAYTVPAWVETARFTGSGAVALTGNSGNNLLAGGAANDTLDGGGTGWDTLEGGGGNDLLVAGATTSLLDGGAGNDTLRGGAGDDYLVAGGGSDVVDGGAGLDWLLLEGDLAQYKFTRLAGNDVLASASASGHSVTLRNVELVQFSATGDDVQLAQLLAGEPGEGNDIVKGGDGNDTLDGRQGQDRMIGGKGDDVYMVDNLGDEIVELAGQGTDTAIVEIGQGTYALAGEVENGILEGNAASGLAGNGAANALTGNGAANTLSGDAGNDTLDGGKGSDVLAGGTGNDTYYVDVAGDTVTELVGEGTDTVITTLARYTLGAHVENATYTGTGAFAGTGNALDNTFSAGTGNDTIDGAGGTDTYVVDGTFRSYTRSRPNATDLVLEKGGQRITLKNVEKVQFSDGLKTLDQLLVNIRSAGADRLEGTDGNDSLDGLAGADRMEGGKGDDIYVADNVADAIIEEAGGGHDTVQVMLAKGIYVLAAQVEDAKVTSTGAAGITGNELANRLTGNAAANALSGGAGNDTLDGDKGNDALAGGAGDDTYVVDAAGDKVTERPDEGTDTVVTALAKYTLAANVENLVYTGSTAFAGTGNALDNVITAGSGNDTIDGAAGNDTLVLAGTFTQYARQRPNATDLVLDNGAQKITLKNIEQVRFKDGTKLLADLYLNVASVGNDVLTGGPGNDQMNGLAGADQLSGGAGDDTYVVDNAGDTLVELANQGFDTVDIIITAKATYTLSANIENATIKSTAAVGVIGNALANVLTGNGAANFLSGGDGNDTLAGGKGNDTLEGGAGNDLYLVDAAGDKVVEGSDGGRDIVETTATKYTLAANVEELRFTGKGAFTGTGNAGDNVIAGGAGNDKLTGGAGADTFVIGAGNDTITDFASGVDHLLINRSIGKGAFDAVTLNAPGGFAPATELVIFTQTIKSLKPADAARAIGSATDAYADGATALFALHDAKSTALYLFTSSGSDATVSGTELVQIATLTGVTTASAGGFLFS